MTASRDDRSSPHQWYEDRLVLRAARLLGEEEQDAVDAHADECRRCAAALGALRTREAFPGFEPSSGHIPPTLLARWSSPKRRPPAVLERAVDQHLSHCAECRADLVLVSRLREEASRAGTRRRWSFTPTWIALPAAACVALVAWVVMNPSLPRGTGGSVPAPQGDAVTRTATPTRALAPAPAPTPAPAPPPASMAPRTGAPAGIQLALASGRPASALRLVPRTRDGATTVNRVRFDADGAAWVRLTPILDCPAETPVTVELLDATGHALARTRLRVGDFHGGAVLRIAADAGALPRQACLLRVHVLPKDEVHDCDPDEAADSVEYPLLFASR